MHRSEFVDGVLTVDGGAAGCRRCWRPNQADVWVGSALYFLGGLSHVFQGDHTGLVLGGGRQCIVCEAVDLAGHAAGLGMHHFDGVGFEQSHLVGGAGAVEPVQQVAFGFGAAQSAEVMSDDQALAEGLVQSHAQAFSQFAQSDQQQAQARF